MQSIAIAILYLIMGNIVQKESAAVLMTALSANTPKSYLSNFISVKLRIASFGLLFFIAKK
jgi:hypothetical protein